MGQPKVSILISFYNLAPYVDETLESVLSQKTNFSIEVLCADDGSTDDTVEKLRIWERRHPNIVRVFVMDFTPGEKRHRTFELNVLMQSVAAFLTRPAGSISAT